MKHIFIALAAPVGESIQQVDNSTAELAAVRGALSALATFTAA